MAARYLLDTHLLLWWLSDDPALSLAAREQMENPENIVFVSAVSLWEARLKQSLGKLDLPETFLETITSQPFELLPLTAAHTSAIATLAWHHRDPFDRMLIAQALSEGLILLTADAALGSYGVSVKVVSKDSAS